MDDKNEPITESNSLEAPDTSPLQSGVVAKPADTSSGVVQPGSAGPESPKPPRESLLRRFLNRVNLYLILLVLVLLGLGGISYYAVVQNDKSAKDNTLKTQELTQDALDKLAGTDATIGDAKQTLSIESNAVFSGGVLVRGNIDIAGTVKVGGPLSLPGLTVGGTTNLNQAALKSLTVAGDTTVQGKLTIQNGLSVAGGASFSGGISAPQITIDTLQLNRDLQINRHIDAGGSIPSRSNGTGLGSGGTASNSGSDTAGTVTINTGNGAPAGCFVTLTFAQAFASVPHVVITPVGSVVAGLSYYINRSTTSFSICTASDPPDNTAGIAFDYIVID